MDKSIIQKAFQGSIIDLLGLQDLPEEKKLAMLEKLSDVVGMRAVERARDRLLPSEADEFMALIETKPDEAMAWLSQKGISFEEMLMEEVAKVKEELVARTADIL